MDGLTKAAGEKKKICHSFALLVTLKSAEENFLRVRGELSVVNVVLTNKKSAKAKECLRRERHWICRSKLTQSWNCNEQSFRLSRACTGEHSLHSSWCVIVIVSFVSSNESCWERFVDAIRAPTCYATEMMGKTFQFKLKCNQNYGN